MLYSKSRPLCTAGVETEWAAAWIQTRDGRFENDPVAAPKFYADRAHIYAVSARTLRAFLKRSADEQKFSACDSTTPAKIDAMAERAAALGRLAR
jgi:hypothetical protein